MKSADESESDSMPGYRHWFYINVPVLDDVRALPFVGVDFVQLTDVARRHGLFVERSADTAGDYERYANVVARWRNRHRRAENERKAEEARIAVAVRAKQEREQRQAVEREDGLAKARRFHELVKMADRGVDLTARERRDLEVGLLRRRMLRQKDATDGSADQTNSAPARTPHPR